MKSTIYNLWILYVHKRYFTVTEKRIILCFYTHTHTQTKVCRIQRNWIISEKFLVVHLQISTRHNLKKKNLLTSHLLFENTKVILLKAKQKKFKSLFMISLHNCPLEMNSRRTKLDLDTKIMRFLGYRGRKNTTFLF